PGADSNSNRKSASGRENDPSSKKPPHLLDPAEGFEAGRHPSGRSFRKRTCCLRVWQAFRSGIERYHSIRKSLSAKNISRGGKPVKREIPLCRQCLAKLPRLIL